MAEWSGVEWRGEERNGGGTAEWKIAMEVEVEMAEDMRKEERPKAGRRHGRKEEWKNRRKREAGDPAPISLQKSKKAASHRGVSRVTIKRMGEYYARRTIHTAIASRPWVR